MPQLRDRAKRKTISYAEIEEQQEEDIALSEDEEGDDSGVFHLGNEAAVMKSGTVIKRRKIAHRNSSKSSKPPPAEKQFRFLDLPAELRNSIYEIAIANDNRGCTLVSTRSAGRTTVKGARVHNCNQDPFGGHYRQRSRLLYDEEVMPAPYKPLVPALLGVNKQIYNEAAPLMYGQKFTFQDMRTMECFLSMIGSRNRKLLLDLCIKQWTKIRGSLCQNRSAITWLQDATKLETLDLDCQIGFSKSIAHKAEQVYGCAYRFLEGYASVDGRSKDAGASIIKLSDSNFDNSSYWGVESISDDLEENQAEFLRHLKAKLKYGP